jgi:hypothetical protein
MKSLRTEAELTKARDILVRMEADSSLITKSAYRANAERWPKNRITFIDIHMEYLNIHPEITVEDYLSNLRLKIRKNTTYK